MRNTGDYDRLKTFSGRWDILRSLWTVIKVTFSSLTLLSAALAASFAVMVWIQVTRVPDLSCLTDYQPGADMQIYDRNNNLVAVVSANEKRQIVPLSKISPALKKAVLAIEDHSFYAHKGVSFTGILRATLANMTAGKPVQGGSTITQQLVKNIFFEQERRTLDLKVAEGYLASELERRYSKDKILEMYLNEVYFGSRSYGAQQAAITYFGKNASNLTIGEAAFLAGLLKSPATLGKPSQRYAAMHRRQDVIDQMVEHKFITFAEGRWAMRQPLAFNTSVPNDDPVDGKVPKYPYYTRAVVEQISDMLPRGRLMRGLKVYTNLDQQVQQVAERTMAAGVRNAPRGIDQAALVSILVSDGSVVALVGGVGDYLHNQWNCATNPHTMGSAFKPFVYLTAFNNALLTPESTVPDEPMTIKEFGQPDWVPKNFDGKFLGNITVTQALAYSRNMSAIWVAQHIGTDRIIETARQAGITDKLDTGPAMALGTSATTPLAMANAYATIARGGVIMTPRLIRRIEDKAGKELLTMGPDPRRVFSLLAVSQLVDVLKEAVEKGTGTQARLANHPVAGKTGTADQGKDIWFVGFTPDVVTAVWAGNSKNKPVPDSHVTGGTVMAKIWREYNQGYYRVHPSSAGLLITSNMRPMKEPPKPITKRATPIQTGDVPIQTGDAQTPYQRMPVPGKSAPTGAVVVRSSSGVTEFQWNR